jgi:hypothetical protein
MQDSGKRERGDRSLVLPAERGDAYLNVLAASLDMARLNDYYPPAENVLSSLFAMMSSVHGGLYDAVKVHAETGMPVYNEFIRVETDWLDAPRELRKLEKWKERRGEAIYEKLAAKREYLSRLLRLPMFFDEKMQLYFRKIEPETRRALFRIILDRISGQGYLERITVDLGQCSSLWSRKNLSLDDRDVAHCQEYLRGLIYRFSNLDVEFLFFQLSQQPHVTVERVIKGRVGPFVFGGIEPKGNESLMSRFAGEGHLFSASLNLADVDQPMDSINDPFFSEKTLSPEARQELRESRKTHAYGVLRDRKFVACGAEKEALLIFLEEKKTKNILYDLKGS